MMSRTSVQIAATASVSLLLVMCAFLSPSSVWADKRGVKIEGRNAADYVAEQIGKSWAVLIGIDDYEHAPRLHYAVADAKAVADTLAKRGYQVVTLYNTQATKDAIEEELGDKLVDRVGEQDRVVIFYSGHGQTKTVKGGKTQGFLLPVGGEQERLAKTGISMGRIRELAEALPSKHVLFLVDVCYGGIAGTQFKSLLPKYTAEYYKAITKERGRQLITAGGAGQQALEGPEWGHSVFTYYLLEGLNKGLADLNSDGIIPASELYSYLDSRVFAAARMKEHEQRPELWTLAAEKGEFVFFTSATGKPGPARMGTASPGESEALAAERQRLEAERQQIEAARARQQQEETERARVDAERQQAERQRLDEERRQLQAERERLEAERRTAERAQLEAERKRLETERRAAEAMRQEAERKKLEEARARPYSWTVGGTFWQVAAGATKIAQFNHDGTMFLSACKGCPPVYTGQWTQSGNTVSILIAGYPMTCVVAGQTMDCTDHYSGGTVQYFLLQ